MKQYVGSVFIAVAYASNVDNFEPSISTTNTCLLNLGAVSVACTPGDTGFPDGATCCPAVTTFAAASCFCNPLVAARGGAALEGVTAFFKQGCQGVVPECPQVPNMNTGSCSMSADLLDAMRFSTLNQFSASLSFNDGDPDYYLELYRQLFTEDSVWHLTSTGKYYGPQAILEYARIADPVINEQIGNRVTVTSKVDSATVRMYLDAITYNTDSSYCFGQTLTPEGISCVNTLDAGAYYEVIFPPCSAQIATLYTEVAEKAVSGLINSRFSLYDMCSLIQRECTGEFQVYDSTQDCYDYLSQRSLTACKDLEIMGDSQACAWLHTGLLIFDKNHCFHTGKEVADLNGKYKCNAKDCVNGFTEEYRAKKGLCPSIDECCSSSEAACGAQDAPGIIAACTCEFDPYCCTTAWDAQCKAQATAACGMQCV